MRHQNNPPEIIFYTGIHGNIESDTVDCDCDCACVQPDLAHAFVGDQGASIAGQTLVSADYRSQPLDAGYRVVYGPGVHPAVLNQAALRLLETYRRPAAVVPAQDTTRAAAQMQSIARLCSLGLLTCLDRPMPGRDSTAQPLLNAWLHITNRCNLRCAYCYLPHHPEEMSLETGQIAVESVFRSALRHNFRQVKFKYAGGEPTLNFALVEQVHRLAQELAGRHGLGLSAVLLSNGTRLTDRTIRRIRTLNIQLMVSLDSLGQPSDPRRDGQDRASSPGVQNAIDQLLVQGIRPKISITISRQNIRQLDGLLAWVLERGLPFSLNFYRPPVGSAAAQAQALEPAETIAGLRAAFRQVEMHLPDHSLLDALLDRVRLSTAHRSACGRGQSYLAIDPQGRIARCQMEIGQPISSIYAEDPLADVHLDPSEPLQARACGTCEVQPWCAGGCPLLDRNSALKSSYCEIYRVLIPEIWRLEGLRLLQGSTRQKNLPFIHHQTNHSGGKTDEAHSLTIIHL